MYTKLLKHECKANLRCLIPLYLILFFTTITVIGLSYITFITDKLPFITNLFFFGYILSLILLSAFTIVLVIYRFYKNFMTGEGYLMFTLPASTHALILSKLTTAMLSIIVTFFLVFASIFLVGNTVSRSVHLDIPMQSFSLSNYVDHLGIGNIFYIIILVILAIALQTLFYYLCISIGQMITQNKLIGSLIAYIALSTILQVVALIAIVPIGILVKDPNNILSYIHILLPIMILGSIFITVIFYLGIHHILKKKLNLE